MFSIERSRKVRLVYETHMHTPLCRHAGGEIEEYAEVADQRGIKGIIVTCHNAMPAGYAALSRMSEDEFPQYLAMVERARRAYEGRVDVRLGLECDYMPLYENWLREQTASADFNYVLGSVHPHTDEFRDAFWRGDAAEYQITYFEQLALAAESRLFDCLAHPDMVKNSRPMHWDMQRVMPHICRMLDRVAAAGIALELNTSGLDKEIAEMNPGLTFLKEMKRRDIPAVVGSDAHFPEMVGIRFRQAYDLLELAGYRQISFFLQRKRIDLDISAARRSLRA